MARPRFQIDDDIRRAETLPGWVYSDLETFARARERVFLPSWQLAADTDRVKVPGAVHPFTLLEGAIDEPLVLTRDREDRLHCVSNVCTHRGTPVAEHPGVETVLRCRYHGRRFSLDGRFMTMPEFEGVEGFHIPYVHAGLSGVLDYGEYRTELYEWSNLQLGIAQGAGDAFDLPASSPDRGQRVAAYYFWLFPNTMFSVYRGESP